MCRKEKNASSECCKLTLEDILIFGFLLRSWSVSDVKKWAVVCGLQYLNRMLSESNRIDFGFVIIFALQEKKWKYSHYF